MYCSAFWDRSLAATRNSSEPAERSRNTCQEKNLGSRRICGGTDDLAFDRVPVGSMAEPARSRKAG